MDFQFRKDSVGRAEVRCSMGHEALANWLSTELNRTAPLNDVIGVVEQLLRGDIDSHRIIGADFVVELDRNGVIVSAQLLGSEMASDEMEDLHYYDEESRSDCGLDDFYDLIKQWHEYLASM